MPMAPRVNGTSGDDLIIGLDSIGNVIYGGEGNDTIYGGAQGDVLVGEAGRDSLFGGAGDDSLWGGGGDDSLDGGDGNDHLFGDGGNDTLSGGLGDDVLDGGTGADTMAGGVGDDTYYVDNAGDVVTELASEGFDTVYSTVSFTLTSGIERLVLSGTSNLSASGNGLDNALTGNDGDNVIDGGAGADAMAGGLGNDTYLVDNLGDTVTENAGAGVDTIVASVNQTLGANVENLTLTGTANLSGTGNGLNNVIIANSGNNALNAGGGADTIYAGDGNDGIFAGGGNDTVFGGAGKDTIYGDAGNDIISGGAGSDLLFGGQMKSGFSAGNDTFVWAFADAVDASGVSAGFDHVGDWASGDCLDFSQLGFGASAAQLFQVTDTAAGTVISADFGGTTGVVDLVMLDSAHGLSFAGMIASGALLV